MWQVLRNLAYNAHGALRITVGTNGALGDEYLGGLRVPHVSW